MPLRGGKKALLGKATHCRAIHWKLQKLHSSHTLLVYLDIRDYLAHIGKVAG